MSGHGRWAKTNTDSDTLVEHPNAPDDEGACRLYDRRCGSRLGTFTTGTVTGVKRCRDALDETTFFLKSRIVESCARRSEEAACPEKRE
jgi:hypothetical protein